MQELRELVERLEPKPDAPGNWEAVVRDARASRRTALVCLVPTVAIAAGAIFALALFQPWESENPTLLERALAAVDDGPVLHVVLRGEWGGTLVDLDTRARTPVHGETEIWYDPDRELVHEIQRLGETVQHENVYDPGRIPRELVALGRNYQAALRSGSARVAGHDVIDGESVTWITIHSETLPDSSDNKLHEWAQQVAVSNETFKPVATRDTRDGRPPPGGLQRVVELEMLPSGEGDFTADEGRNFDGVAVQGRHEAIEADRAAGVLGRTPLWLGREHAGLPLAQVTEIYGREGRQAERVLAGPEAEDAKACARAMRRARARLEVPACKRMRERRHGFSIRGDTVYEHGPVEWGERQASVSFFYGTLGDDPSTYRRDLVPRGERPHVTITESTWRPPHVRGGTFVPPEGSVFIAVAGINAMLRIDGLYVQIQASSEELILSAARTLEPMQP
jgi:hypothetical protein